MSVILSSEKQILEKSRKITLQRVLFLDSAFGRFSFLLLPCLLAQQSGENQTTFVRWFLPFCSVLLLLGSSNAVALASFQAPENKELYKLPTIYEDAFVRVVSDEKMSKEQGREIAGIAKGAIEFDTKAISFKKNEVPKTFCIAILSPEYIRDTMHSDFGGEALETDLFAAKSTIFKNEKSRFSCVVAHELVHMLVYRLIWELNPRAMGWSRSLDEGLAQIIGAQYALAKQKKLYPSGRIPIKENDKTLSADDAIWVFEHEKLVAKGGYVFSPADSKRWVDSVYPLGRQFIEFLRTGGMKNKSSPQAVKHIGEIVQAMPKDKETFDVEFEKKFGVKLESVRQQFVEHLRATQDNPKHRFQGTIFDIH